MSSFIGGEFAGPDELTGTAGGDLDGYYPNPTVVAIQGNPVEAQTLGAAQDGYVLTWDNSLGEAAFEHITSGSVTLMGDVTGAANNNHVVNITGSGGIIPIDAIMTGSVSGSMPLSYGISNIVMPSDADITLTASQYVNPILRITSTPSLTATRNIVLPAQSGAKFAVYNHTSGGQSLQFIASTGTGVTITNGLKADIYFDGTNYVPSGVIIGGDLSATNNTSETVIGIQGNPIQAGILNSAQDGYVLSWSGTQWQAAPTSSTIIFGQNYSFSNTSSDISGYDQLFDNATGVQATLTAATSNSSKVLIKAFATVVSDPDVDVIDAGVWQFDFYASTSLTGAFTTTLIFDVYTRTSGSVETLLFSAVSQNIQSTSTQLYTLMYNYQNVTLMPNTDRIVIKVSAQSTNAVPTTVSFTFDGTVAASLVQTPITGSALQLGGNVTGTTSSSTVVSINGATVPAGGSLTTGNTLGVTGSSALGYSALNLAGGAGYVTGALPSANQAPQIMGGDVTGTTAANTVVSLTGSGGVVTIPSGTTNLTGAAPTSDVAPGAITITGHAPFASAVTNTSAGNLVLATAAPVGAGAIGTTSIVNDGYTQLQLGYASTDYVSFGQVPSSSGYIRIPAGNETIISNPGGATSGVFIGSSNSGTTMTLFASNVIQFGNQDTSISTSGFNWVLTGGSGLIPSGQALFTIQPSTRATAEAVTIAAGTGLGAASTSSAGALLTLQGGAAAVATSGTVAGAAGGAVNITSGAGAAGLGGTSNGGAAGNITLTTGTPGAPVSSGTAGAIGTTSIVNDGYTQLQLGYSPTDYVALGQLPAQSGFIRIPYASSESFISYRNSGNTSDLNAVSLNGGSLWFGNVTQSQASFVTANGSFSIVPTGVLQTSAISLWQPNGAASLSITPLGQSTGMPVNINAGQSTTAGVTGGALTLNSAIGTGGASLSAAGGAVNINGAAGTVATSGTVAGAAGGALNLTSGAGAAGLGGTSNGGAAGNITLTTGTPGAATSGGTNGAIGTLSVINDGYTQLSLGYSANDYMSFGQLPAQTGFGLRFPFATSSSVPIVSSRNSTNTGDNSVVSLTNGAFGGVVIGSPNIATVTLEVGGVYSVTMSNGNAFQLNTNNLVPNIPGAFALTPTASATGIAVSINAGKSLTAGTTGGALALNGAIGTGGASLSAAGGAVAIAAAAGTVATSGTAAGAVGGAVNITSGAGAAGLGGTSNGGAAGNITLTTGTPGAPVSSGTAGAIGTVSVVNDGYTQLQLGYASTDYLSFGQSPSQQAGINFPYSASPAQFLSYRNSTNTADLSLINISTGIGGAGNISFGNSSAPQTNIVSSAGQINITGGLLETNGITEFLINTPGTFTIATGARVGGTPISILPFANTTAGGTGPALSLSAGGGTGGASLSAPGGAVAIAAAAGTVATSGTVAGAAGGALNLTSGAGAAGLGGTSNGGNGGAVTITTGAGGAPVSSGTAGSVGTFSVSSGGTTVLQLAQAATDSLSFGVSPSQQPGINLSYYGGVATNVVSYRNSGGTGDNAIIQLNASALGSGALLFGNTTATKVGLQNASGDAYLNGASFSLNALTTLQPLSTTSFSVTPNAQATGIPVTINAGQSTTAGVAGAALALNGAIGTGGASLSPAGGAVNINGAAGVVATSGTAAGAAGGAVNVTSGAGAAGFGSNQNGGAGGNISITPGAGGAATGSGTAGTAGNIVMAGTTIGVGTTTDFGATGTTRTEGAWEFKVGPSNKPAISGINNITTTNAVATTILSLTPVNNSVDRWTVSVIGLDTSGDGYYYGADLSFDVITTAGTVTLNPTTPAAANVRSAGLGSGASVAVSIISNVIYIKVTGIASYTYDWTAIAQIVRTV